MNVRIQCPHIVLIVLNLFQADPKKRVLVSLLIFFVVIMLKYFDDKWVIHATFYLSTMNIIYISLHKQKIMCFFVFSFSLIF